ncbi:ABC transporter permease [Chitinophaga arvensicola]|nr:ABC transporter permease [Chitinophaga arvensicola]
MFISYLKIAFRTIRRNISYTFLNVTGLTISIAACLLIFLIVKDELNYDDFKKADRTYRITLNALDFNPSTSMAVVPALRNDFPELEQVSQYLYQQNGQVKAGDVTYLEKGFAFADNSFFKIFDYPWMAGDPNTALAGPNQVVLTQSIAHKYFGDKDPMGQIIQLEDHFNLRVTGVIKAVPPNTSQPFLFMVSYETIKDKDVAHRPFFNIQGGITYVVLPEHYRAAQLQDRMQGFIAKNWGADIAGKAKLLVQPLKEIHFDQRYLGNPASPTTSRSIYWGLAIVALFIILTACINFINMATAQAISRAKEVGVRKVLGAYRVQLIRQFLAETGLLVVTAVVLGFVAAVLLLPYLSSWMNLKIEVSQLMQPVILGVVAGITVTVILLAGLYPAFVQSAFQPVAALKSNTGVTFRGLALRKILVSTQFGISQLLIVGTLIVGYQMDFLQNKDLGFNKTAVISVGIPDDKKQDLLREELLAMPDVQEVSLSAGPMVGGSRFTAFRYPEGGIVDDDVTEFKAVDDQYMKMYSLQLLAGDSIRKRMDNDTVLRVLVNETMTHKLGIHEPEKAIGKRFLVNGGYAFISGVVKDFQSESRYKKRRPCVLFYDASDFFTASIRIKPTDMRKTIAGVDKLWSSLFTGKQFQYQFLDDRIAGLYEQDQKLYTAFKLFSSLAIAIGCLGLYGLVAFAAVQRTKEVSIRKVLGASLFSIIGLFAKEFIVLIIVSFSIAGPLAWWVMNQWLDHFAYQTQISGGTFVIAISISVVIAGVTIAYQSVKAGLVNPVKSLRS